VKELACCHTEASSLESQGNCYTMKNLVSFHSFSTSDLFKRRQENYCETLTGVAIFVVNVQDGEDLINDTSEEEIRYVQ